MGLRALIITAIATFVLDQASKWLVVHQMNLLELGEIDLIPPVLNLRMAWNQGINFGLFANSADAVRWGLIAVALLISGYVLWWVIKQRAGRWAMLSAGLLIGGAMGNVVDRVAYGAVADFLNMSCCGIENPFSFNIADIAVFAGALGLVVFAQNPSVSKPPKRRKTP